MRAFFILVCILVITPISTFAQTVLPDTTIAGGTFDSSGSPYVLMGNLTVENLTIEAGVTVEAGGYFGISVVGTLSAVGAVSVVAV